MPESNVSGCNGLSRCDVTQAGLGNVAAFTGNMSIPQSDNFGVARLDHDFSDKWHFMASYRYYKLTRITDSQYDIGGTAVGGGALGTPTSLSSRPQQPWFLVGALTTNITNNTTNDFHFSYLRNYWSWGSAANPPQIAGLGGALEPLGELSAGARLRAHSLQREHPKRPHALLGWPRHHASRRRQHAERESPLPVRWHLSAQLGLSTSAPTTAAASTISPSISSAPQLVPAST